LTSKCVLLVKSLLSLPGCDALWFGFCYLPTRLYVYNPDTHQRGNLGLHRKLSGYLFVCVCVLEGGGSSVEFHFKGNKVFVTYLDSIVGKRAYKTKSLLAWAFLYDLTHHPKLGFSFLILRRSRM